LDPPYTDRDDHTRHQICLLLKLLHPDLCHATAPGAQCAVEADLREELNRRSRTISLIHDKLIALVGTEMAGVPIYDTSRSVDPH
jgi:hypothetical protein